MCMKSKLFRAALCCLAALLLLTVSVLAEHTTAVDEAKNLIDGIVASQAGEMSVQEWIDGPLTQAPDTSEWYAIGLSQHGDYDLSSYERALLSYLNGTTVSSASSRQKYALALIACGSTDAYIRTVLNESIGQQGVMSWVFGLHLLNNGYRSDTYSLAAVTKRLLSLRHEDGGWSITGQYGDADVTAMAVQALAPQYGDDTAVTAAVDSALTFLSSKQKEAGDYASYGVANPESTAQVLVALSALGIDAATDTRFIKNGNTVFDGIRQYRLPDGSFCHTLGGATNGTATVQVFYAMVAYQRFCMGKSPMNLLDVELRVPTVTTTAPPTAAAEQQNGGYKPWATVAIAVVAGVLCAVLLCRQKKNVKNLLAVLLVAAVLIGAVWLTDMQSTKEHYRDAGNKENAIGTVTLTIRCDTVPDKSASHIPDDGVLLEQTAFEIEAGDTVFDILQEAVASHKLHLESSGGADAVYIKGIGNLYEFDFGDLSGWMYFVNGEKPPANCGEYVLADGDSIEWLYTCSLGEDLK